MTIKTLEFIHAQLIEAKDKAEMAKKFAREIYYKAEEENAPNLKCLEERYANLREAAAKAHYALEEFESEDW